MKQNSSPRLHQHGWRILIAGTGGQGVITAAQLLTEFCVHKGHQVTSGQLHGMAQRGGSVQSSVMVDSGTSPVIPKGGADGILGFEAVETARSLPFMSSQTIVFMNTAPVIPFTLDQNAVRGEGEARYPDVSELATLIQSVTSLVFTVDATHLALDAGSGKALNVVMLGCWFGSGFSPFAPEDFMDTVLKGASAGLREVNTKAFLSGVEFGKTVQEKLNPKVLRSRGTYRD